MNIKNTILDILFPKVCINCGKEGKYICDKCKVFISECEEMSLRETRSLTTSSSLKFLRDRVSNELDGLISVWDYEGLIKELIQMIKYQGITDAIKELISLIDIKVYCQYITYVPMYIKREKRRGFNQAEIIAKEIGKVSNSKVVHLLKKIKDTENQTKLNKEERLQNVKNSFKFCSNIWDRPGLSQDRVSVLLVDDVFTTGATMRECCKVLKKAGIKKVWGFTLARTV